MIMKKKLAALPFLFYVLLTAAAYAQTVHERYPIIPWPDSVRDVPGSFTLAKESAIVVSDDSLSDDASLFNDYLQIGRAHV